jgi:hypothetical protein
MTRIALAGVAGWGLRLLVAGSLAAGGYGVYRALFVPVDQPAPGHDRIAGTIVIGIAIALSLTAFALLSALDKHVRVGWYACAYLVVVALGLGAFFLSCALRLVGEWQRSTVSVTATISDCYEVPPALSDNGAPVTQPADECTYTWSVAGVQYQQVRDAPRLYPDGATAPLWANPTTGATDGHDPGLIVICGIAAASSALAGYRWARRLLPTAHTLRPWWTHLAWWRPSPARASLIAPTKVDH